jgi:hypothetical protein
MFPEYVKSAMDERERSIRDLLRDRRLAAPHPVEVRWRLGRPAGQRRPNGQRGL